MDGTTKLHIHVDLQCTCTLYVYMDMSTCTCIGGHNCFDHQSVNECLDPDQWSLILKQGSLKTGVFTYLGVTVSFFPLCR